MHFDARMHRASNRDGRFGRGDLLSASSESKRRDVGSRHADRCHAKSIRRNHCANEFVARRHRQRHCGRGANNGGHLLARERFGPQRSRPRSIFNRNELLRPEWQSDSAATPRDRHRDRRHLPLLAERIRHQHDLHRERAGRHRCDFEATRGSRHHPLGSANSRNGRARRTNAFHTDHKSGQDCRERRAGGAMK